MYPVSMAVTNLSSDSNLDIAHGYQAVCNVHYEEVPFFVSLAQELTKHIHVTFV